MSEDRFVGSFRELVEATTNPDHPQHEAAKKAGSEFEGQHRTFQQEIQNLMSATTNFGTTEPLEPLEGIEVPRDPAWEAVWAIRDSTRLNTLQIILGCIGLVGAVGLSVRGQIVIGTLIAAMVPTVLLLVGRR